MTIYEEIQAAIDYAWATADPQTKQQQAKLIGDTHKPTPEELILAVIKEVFSKC